MSTADLDPVANILAVSKSPVATTHLFNTITSDPTLQAKTILITLAVKYKIYFKLQKFIPRQYLAEITKKVSLKNLFDDD